MVKNISVSKNRQKQRLKVIIITGTPGVGKTVTSKILANRLGALYVNITDIVKDKHLILGFDEKRDTLIANLTNLSKSIREIINNSSKDVIIDGHYAMDVVSLNLVSFIFVLRRNPNDLKIKLEERGYSKKKVLENVASEVLDVCLTNAIRKYSLKKVDEIDVTYITADEAVDEILQVIDGQKPVCVGKVNWLGMLEAEGKVEAFLNDIN